VSAYVDSSELHLTPIPSRPDSRRHDSIECMPLDDRLPHSMDTAANALLQDETLYRDDIPAFVDRNDSSSPPATPDVRDTTPVGEGSTIVEPLAEEDGIITTSEQALD
jgi:hypothetical protein